jgi:hypothetical protein
VESLTPLIGKGRANTLVWSTIWLIPGVFGFLVWELKENWRLYAANRRRQLAAIPIGSHGETMVGLLRLGFHSGTLPKKYAALRRAIRRARRVGDTQRISRRRDDLHHVETAVRRFVQRELIGLCEEARVLPRGALQVGKVLLSTNRVTVQWLDSGAPSAPALITWEEEYGQLTASVDVAGWLETLPAAQRDRLTTALSGLFQRSGADQVRGTMAASVSPAFTWEEWLAFWQDRASTVAMQAPHISTAAPSSRAG